MPVTVAIARCIYLLSVTRRLWGAGGRASTCAYTLWLCAALSTLTGGAEGASLYPFMYTVVDNHGGGQADCEKYAPGTKYDHTGNMVDCYVSLGQDAWAVMTPPQHKTHAVGMFVGTGLPQAATSVAKNPPPLMVPPGTYHLELYACLVSAPTRCSTRGSLVGVGKNVSVPTTTDFMQIPYGSVGSPDYYPTLDPYTLCGVIRDGDGRTWGDSATYGGAICDDSGGGALGSCEIKDKHPLQIDMGTVHLGAIPQKADDMDYTRYTQAIAIECSGESSLDAHVSVKYTGDSWPVGGHQFMRADWNFVENNKILAGIGVNGVGVYPGEPGPVVRLRPGSNELTVGAALVRNSPSGDLHKYIFPSAVLTIGIY